MKEEYRQELEDRLDELEERVILLSSSAHRKTKGRNKAEKTEFKDAQDGEKTK